MTDTLVRISSRTESRTFYLTMALICAAVAFLGFAPTYFVPMTKGAFHAPLIYHLHGMIFFVWTIYFVYQTWLVPAGRTALHRSVGLIGISLATAMVIFGSLLSILSTRRDTAAGMGPASRAFMIVPFTDIWLFAVFITLALVWLRKLDRHKRLMLLAMITLLSAPIARWFAVLLAPPGPPTVTPVPLAAGPAAVAGLLIVAAIVYDWRTRGRPHAAYVWGGLAFVAVMLLRVPLSATPAWNSIALMLVNLAG